MKQNFPFKKEAELLVDLDRFSENISSIYQEAIDDYHLTDSINAEMLNPYQPDGMSGLVYLKSWIDCVQWHVEDEIRRPDIDPVEALLLKRRIDALNQQRTDKVEILDHILLIKFSNIHVDPAARINTESPAWALDRLSILILKIFHMSAETRRDDVSGDHISQCRSKLEILLRQQRDIMCSINELIQDIANGCKRMQVYRQMKMYNDPSLNPVLYNNSWK